MSKNNLYIQRLLIIRKKRILSTFKRSRQLFITLVVGAGLTFAVATPAFAAAPQNSNLLTNQWRQYNINTNVSKLWDISNVNHGVGNVEITLSNLSTGWHTAYLNTNYNVDLTGKTITVAANWTPGSFTNRGSTQGKANFRIYFASAQGNYNSYSYWWSTGTANSIDLNNLDGTGSYSVSLTDRSQWSDLCGKIATDTTVYSGPNCVYGTDPAMSPYNGFTDAMKNVKVIGISFGGGSYYANGVANTASTPATFELTQFDVKQ